MSESCVVVEEVVLGAGYAEIMDEAVAVYVVAKVYDYVEAPPASRELVEQVVAADYLESMGYTVVRELVHTREDTQQFRETSLENTVVVTDVVGQVFAEAVTEIVLSAESLVYSHSLQVHEALVIGSQFTCESQAQALSAENVVVSDKVNTIELVTIVDTADALDYVIEQEKSAVVENVLAVGSVQTDVAVSSLVADVARVGDGLADVQSASIVEELVVASELTPYTQFVVKDLAHSTEYLALSTAATQEWIDYGSAFGFAVLDDATLLESSSTAFALLESMVRTQVLSNTQASALDQLGGEVDRGYSAHDQLVASESLHIEISTPLEVLVIANDRVGLGFEAAVPETAGDTYAFAETTGQGVVLVQCLEVLLATASVEFLVGTTSGVYEMLAAEYITVYDRVEVVEALDSFAWVLNSQSLAHSYYDGFVDFNSAVQLGKHIYMLSPSGLYELGGDSDDGKIIEAEVVTGQMDFGTIARKRVEQIDLGYVASGDLQAVVSCEGFDPSDPQTLEVRDMQTAHTSRVRVGKGMVGKYWKFELKNREGADFELFSIQSKVALSTRRMR